jgi:hypothetical protein
MVKVASWKNEIKEKELRVNMEKTKVMRCNVGSEQVEDSSRWTCDVCR